MDICEATYKEKHNRATAVKHLKDLKKKCGYVGEVYKCKACGTFHVGRNNGKKINRVINGRRKKS